MNKKELNKRWNKVRKNLRKVCKFFTKSTKNVKKVYTGQYYE